jgi:HEPN domain-containing protein/predicted nucleotidyltransferase
MLETLDAVIERLVSAYDPDRIILFGSQASGDARHGSDIDLLVVKETDQRPLSRRMEVERLLADRSVALDIFVYTPREVRELYAAGSPFIEEVIESGRVLYMRKTTGAWLAEARDELESASILLDNSKWRAACLHSQQSVEKGLKALILEKGKRPPRTHDIIKLLNAVLKQGWALELEMDDAVYLNSIYRGRYPTEEGLLPHGEASSEDARRALKAANTVMIQLQALLGHP